MFPTRFFPGPQGSAVAPAANQTTCQLYTRDQTGEALAGVIVKFQITAAPADERGSAYDSTPLSVTSDANGLVSTELPIGATVEYWARIGEAVGFVVPASGPYELADVIGKLTA